jgi:hypothetical protein
MQAVPIAFALGLVLLAPAARAQMPDPEPLRLTYRSAPTCPDVETFKDIVSASLAGKDPFVEQAPHRLDVGVQRLGPAHFVADAVLSEATGKVLFQTEQVAPNCVQALRWVAVMVGSWWAPIVVGKPAEVPAPPKAEPAAAPPVCPAPAPAPRCGPEPVWQPSVAGPPEAPPVEKKVPVTFRVGAGVWADHISDSGGSIGLTLDAGVRRGWFSAAVEGRGDPPIGSTPAPNAGSVSFARATGALLLCTHYNVLVGCLKGQVGRLLFSGTLPALPAQRYAAAGVRVGLEFPVVPWFLMRLDGELLPPIDPAPAAYRNQTLLFQVAGLNAGIGLSAMFAVGEP